MFTYRQILGRAWQTAWRNPILWFFGVFLALLGVGGEIEILLGSVALADNQALVSSLVTGLFEGGLFSPAGIFGLGQTLLTKPLNFLSLLLWLGTILVLTILVIWLVIVSQGAVIKGIVNIIKRKPLSWAEHFEAGLATFWPVLVLNALAKLIFSTLFIFLGYLALLEFRGALPFFILAFIVFVSLIVIVAFVIKYAICAVVLNRQSVGDALRLAIKLFQNHWLLSLEIAVVLFVVYWVITAILVNLVVVFFVATLDALGAGGSIALLAFIVALLLAVLVQTLLAIFHWTAWVLVFELLTSKKEILSSRLTLWFDRKK